jgi:hypothetical protein
VWNTPSMLTLAARTGDAHQALAYSFFVGYAPPDPRNWVTKRYAVRTSSGNKKTQLMHTRTGFCYFHKLSGEFNGSEERARIYPTVDSRGDEWWTFETHEGGGRVYASVQCVPYWQSDERPIDW